MIKHDHLTMINVLYTNFQVLDCGCTPGAVAANAITNVGENEVALAVCDLPGSLADGESGKGAIWTLSCDANKNGGKVYPKKAPFYFVFRQT